MWGTRPSCHGDTPHRQPFSATPPRSRPRQGQLIGVEKAKVTLVLGPGAVGGGGGVPSVGFHALNCNMGFGEEV